MADAQRDLQVLARHLSTILGRAMAMEPTQRGTGSEERDHRGVAHALEILGRLVAVPWSSRLVLVYAYLVTGPEARMRSSGFATRVGLVFASPSQRMSWLTMKAKSMGLGAASTQGQRLLEFAEQAYARVGEIVTENDGRWLSLAIDRVTRMDALASRDLRDLVRVREMNRCAPLPGTAKNRKERRELQRQAIAKDSRTQRA